MMRWSGPGGRISSRHGHRGRRLNSVVSVHGPRGNTREAGAIRTPNIELYGLCVLGGKSGLRPFLFALGPRPNKSRRNHSRLIATFYDRMHNHMHSPRCLSLVRSLGVVRRGMHSRSVHCLCRDGQTIHRLRPHSHHCLGSCVARRIAIVGLGRPEPCTVSARSSGP
jgi:hypothetical protein